MLTNAFTLLHTVFMVCCRCRSLSFIWKQANISSFQLTNVINWACITNLNESTFNDLGSSERDCSAHQWQIHKTPQTFDRNSGGISWQIHRRERQWNFTLWCFVDVHKMQNKNHGKDLQKRLALVNAKRYCNCTFKFWGFSIAINFCVSPVSVFYILFYSVMFCFGSFLF